MITATFYLPDGCKQVIKMSDVSASEVQKVCNQIKNDLHADKYDYYIAQ